MRVSFPNMDLRPSERIQKVSKMLPATKGSGRSCGVSRKQTEVLSGMIVWNVLLLALLVLAVCVQGEGGAAPSNVSPHLEHRRAAVKKDGAVSSDIANSAEKPTLPSQTTKSNVSLQPKDTLGTENSSEEDSEEKNEDGTRGGGGETQPTPENKGSNANTTTKDGAGM